MKDLDFLLYNDFIKLYLGEAKIREKEYVKYIRNCFEESLKKVPKKYSLGEKKAYFKMILDESFRKNLNDKYEDLILEDIVDYGEWNGVAYHKYRLFNKAEIIKIKFKYKNIFK